MGLPEPVLGRAVALAVVDEFLDGAQRDAAVLVFTGEPGIGKSTLWRAATLAAAERGIRILAARPAAADVRLSGVGLADLFAEVEEAVLAELPGPQRDAIDAALLRRSPARAATAAALAAAVLALLRRLATAGPVLVAIDDLQWLDTTTRPAVLYALRRLSAEPVRLLATLRVDATGGHRAWLRELPEDQATVVALDGLTAPVLRRIVGSRLHHEFRRPLLSRIVRTAAGNPLFAIEIGRAMLEAPADPAGITPPPIPDDLRQLLVRRLRRLPLDCQRALLRAAAQALPVRRDTDGDSYGPAEVAGIVEINRTGRITFTHPLLASAIYGSAPAPLRRDVHGELAERADDPEERARHLALATAGPDEKVAGALVEAARHAHRRGGPATAADLLELALSATATERTAERHERTLAAAEAHFHAGDRVRARELATRVSVEAPGGEALGRALRLLGLIRYHEDSYTDAVDLFRRAAGHLADHPLVVDLHLNLAHAQTSLNDFADSAKEAEAAVGHARRFGDTALEASALAVATMAGIFVGRPPDWARLAASLALEDPDQQTAIQVQPTWIVGAAYLYLDRFTEARGLLAPLRRRMLDRGEESDLPFLSFHLAMLERCCGNVTAALDLATEGYDLANELASRNLRLLTLAERCFARTVAADLEGARADADLGLSMATGFTYPAGSAVMHAAAAFLALADGDAERAAVLMEPLMASVEATGACHAVAAWFVADAVEAYVASGRIERTGALIASLHRMAGTFDRPIMRALGLRSAAVVYAARGEVKAAIAAVEAAVSVGALAGTPLERGRTFLLYGQLLRRSRQKVRARAALGAALADFEAVGAPLWVARVSAELGRVAPPAGAASDLSPTELRVARLAAAGLTNREVAGRSFLSPKTVETNLARIYRKLGIHSRAELGARMRDE